MAANIILIGCFTMWLMMLAQVSNGWGHELIDNGHYVAGVVVRLGGILLSMGSLYVFQQF